MTRAEVDAWAQLADVDLLLADGFDDCIVGIGQQFTRFFVVYDRACVVQTLVDRDGMTPEEAEEFYDFNIVGGWLGEATPCFVQFDP